MRRITTILFLTFAVLNLSCKEPVIGRKQNDVRADIRLGYKYYSIYANEAGDLYVTKGKSSTSIAPFIIESARKSKMVKSDSAKAFCKNISKLRNTPIIVPSNIADSPRIEIYYDGKKVYDAFLMDGRFWALFRPIIPLLPKGFNPFLTNEHPFG